MWIWVWLSQHWVVVGSAIISLNIPETVMKVGSGPHKWVGRPWSAIIRLLSSCLWWYHQLMLQQKVSLWCVSCKQCDWIAITYFYFCHCGVFLIKLCILNWYISNIMKWQLALWILQFLMHKRHGCCRKPRDVPSTCVLLEDSVKLIDGW